MENHGSKVWMPTQMRSNSWVTFRTLSYHGNWCFDLVADAGLHILKTQILQQWKNYRLFLFEPSHVSHRYANVTRCSHMVIHEIEALVQQTEQGWHALKHPPLALLVHCINHDPHTSLWPAAQEVSSCSPVHAVLEAGSVHSVITQHYNFLWPEPESPLVLTHTSSTLRARSGVSI